MKIPFPFLGTGMRVKNSIPDFRDGNWRTVFPGIPGNGNGITKLGQFFVVKLLTRPSALGMSDPVMVLVRLALVYLFLIVVRVEEVTFY